MTAPLELVGVAASSGFARGPLFLLAEIPAATVTRAAGPAAGQVALLRAALDAAARELTALMEAADDADARTLLEFQIAMLEDDHIVRPALVAIAAGDVADAAWRVALEAHIDEYRDADDPYFAARALDLQDMRDRVLRCLVGTARAIVPAGSIVVATDLAPSRFLEIDWHGGGIALFAGSPQSHVATLARARGVPMIVRLATPSMFPPGDVLLDADHGVLIAGPDITAVRAFESRRAAADRTHRADLQYVRRPASTADGERVQVLLNVAQLDDVRMLAPQDCDGIGLVRTELFLREPAQLRDEQCQFEQYRTIVDWADGRPVTFRTLDAGGDKPIDGYTLRDEANPFLGMRGVRLSLRYPDILRVQLRALARVAAVGNVRIMVPMISIPDELDRVRTMLIAAVAELRAGGRPCALPPLGMMVEVPAAALTIDLFAADFFSIGSNDLVAYTMAASRDGAAISDANDPPGPAVLRLIRQVVEAARIARSPLSLCGDMAGDARYLPALLAAGLRSFSIAPALLGRVKATIAAYVARADD